MLLFLVLLPLLLPMLLMTVDATRMRHALAGAFRIL